MNVVWVVCAGLIGYLCGAIPFGYIYVKLKTGQDIRQIGSGRTGGTNSLRAGGALIGAMTALSDVAKGYAAIWLVRQFLSSTVSTEMLPWLIATAGVCSVFGHNWSIFMRFGGGAGTGPNVGWGTAVWWPMFPVGLVLMVVMLLTVGMASVASMAMAAILIIVFALLYFLGIAPYDATIAYMVGGLISGAIVVYALRPNIQRLMNGTERVVGPRAKRIAQREAKRREAS